MEPELGLVLELELELELEEDLEEEAARGRLPLHSHPSGWHREDQSPRSRKNLLRT